ncbi:hypothetical protein SEA_TWONLO_64 [Gordonia phage Twonlo]|nr:hypothetical protein SEA_TWONLO_64 [Gordonia phage Twonlo]
MTRYLRTDQPELVEWNKTGQGVHTRYGLDGKPIATGQLGDPAGVLVAIDDSPVAAALWDAHEQRRELSRFRADANRLNNELAHAKAIANGVQNALRDQLGEARADRDKVIDQMLTQHREFWNDAVDIRTTSELMKIEGTRYAKARDEYRERLDEIGRMLVDTAGNLGLTIADGAAPEQIAHQIANSTHERMVDDLQYEGRTAADMARIIESFAASAGIAIAECESLTSIIDRGKRAVGIARRVVEIIEAPTTQDHPDDAVIGFATEAVESVGIVDRMVQEHREIAKALGYALPAQDPTPTGQTLVQRARVVLGDRDTLESKYDDALGAWRKAEARVEQLKAANNTLQNLTSRVTSDEKAEQAIDRLVAALDRQQFVAYIGATPAETIRYQIDTDHPSSLDNAAALLQLAQGCLNGEFAALVAAWRDAGAARDATHHVVVHDADEPASPNVDDDQSPTPCITEHGNTTTEGSTE